jgi:hypothetical protein
MVTPRAVSQIETSDALLQRRSQKTKVIFSSNILQSANSYNPIKCVSVELFKVRSSAVVLCL